MRDLFVAFIHLSLFRVMKKYPKTLSLKKLLVLQNSFYFCSLILDCVRLYLITINVLTFSKRKNRSFYWVFVVILIFLIAHHPSCSYTSLSAYREAHFLANQLEDLRDINNLALSCLKRIARYNGMKRDEREVDDGRDERKGLKEKISAEERKDYHPNRIHLPGKAWCWMILGRGHFAERWCDSVISRLSFRKIYSTVFEF